MEAGDAAAAVSTEKQGAETGSSYRYWVREKTQEAAPPPVPKKLSAEDISNQSNQSPNVLGSAWNRAGTWEEKNLNNWASGRLKELLASVAPLDFSDGNAEISEVTKCSGDAFSVTVRNKKCVGYTYEMTLRVEGEWLIGSEKKKVKGHIDIAEFSFGELDDLQIEVSLSEVKDLVHQDKSRITQDLKKFLPPIREKLSQFECEIKDR